MNELVDSCLEAYREVRRALLGAASEWLLGDLSMGQLKVLIVLREAEATSIGSLAQRLGVSFPAASLMVDRLVQHGLVERRSDSLDRRRVLVRLTGRGEESAERLWLGSAARFRRWLLAMAPDDLAALERGLRALEAAARADGAAPVDAAAPLELRA